MNLLQLCNRAITECGVSGGPLTTAQNQSGSLGRIVNWVIDSWNEIQAEHDDWNWLRSSNILGAGASFVTLAGVASYPLGTGPGTVGIAADSFGKWDEETFRCFPTSVGVSGELHLDNVDFDVWRDAYMFGAMRSVQTRPVAVAIGPDLSLNFGPPSNGLYTVTGDYFLSPSILTADADKPIGLPLRYHLLIVYRAMMKYAGYESAPEVYSRGSMEHKLMMAQLEAVQMPKVAFAGELGA